MKTDKIILWIIIFAVLIRIPLLFLNPVTMWADPSFRYLPNTHDVLEGDFTFYTPPLLMIINALPTIFLDGTILEFAWKLTPFIFFLLSVFIFIKILNIIELKRIGKIFLLCLFLFSVYSILMSTSIMLEMLVLFFTLALFYIFEKNERINLRLFFIISVTSALLLYSKQTGYFVLAGFLLYTIFKKMDRRQKKLILMALLLGFLLNAPWIIKNNVVYGSFLSTGYGEEGTGGIAEWVDFDKNPLSLISRIFHLAYRIPSLDKLNYSGIFFILSRIYYFSFVIASILLSLTIVIGLVKFGSKYKRYLLIILPIFLLVFWFAFLFHMHYTHDFGRYMFSLYFLFFFFSLKFIESLKSSNAKRFFYLIIILFCIFSVVTSFAMSYEFHKKDIEIRKVNDFMIDKEGNFIADDHFTKHALTFYSGKKILQSNEGIACNEGEEIYSNQKYKIYLRDLEYYICKS